jgi:hypothetical protein
MNRNARRSFLTTLEELNMNNNVIHVQLFQSYGALYLIFYSCSTPSELLKMRFYLGAEIFFLTKILYN